jgi:hypothetical protein
MIKKLEFLIVYNTNSVQENIQINMSQQQQQMSLVIEINYERIIIIVKKIINFILINIINGCQTLLLKKLLIIS